MKKRIKNSMLFFHATLIMVALIISSSTFALESDQDQPIHISSNTLKIDEKKRVSIYLGDVIYKQGSIHLTADKATVKTTDNRALDNITAEGNKATFSQQVDEKTKVIAHANTIKYNASSGIIELIDEAYIQNNKDTFTAEYITYDVAKKLITSQGGRTEITIHPNKNKATENKS